VVAQHTTLAIQDSFSSILMGLITIADEAIQRRNRSYKPVKRTVKPPARNALPQDVDTRTVNRTPAATMTIGASRTTCNLGLALTALSGT
jgi:hypothetical protein